mmetsp:Transcript_34197/g.75845  ORF Transcript_34197/g.75845 Transcript_34197/m.75845 type:complete len:357 (+) Transcript_34197:183-1253(+)
MECLPSLFKQPSTHCEELFLPGTSGKRCSLGDSLSGHSADVSMPELTTSSKKVPTPAPWISLMLQSQFFVPCEAHKHLKKNECTYFCTTCAKRPVGLCQHCISEHTGHQTIQIRRYVYCDVVRAVDITPHVDISGVQCYIINQAKVVFLNHRPQSKMGRPLASDTCRTCNRHLREGFSYCSVACKVDALNKGLEVPSPLKFAPAASPSAPPTPNAAACTAHLATAHSGCSTALDAVQPTSTDDSSSCGGEGEEDSFYPVTLQEPLSSDTAEEGMMPLPVKRPRSQRYYAAPLGHADSLACPPLKKQLCNAPSSDSEEAVTFTHSALMAALQAACSYSMRRTDCRRKQGAPRRSPDL